MAGGPEGWLTPAAVKEYAIGIIMGWASMTAMYFRLMKQGIDLFGSKSKLLAENAGLKTDNKHFQKDIAERDERIAKRDALIDEMKAEIAELRAKLPPAE